MLNYGIALAASFGMAMVAYRLLFLFLVIGPAEAVYLICFVGFPRSAGNNALVNKFRIAVGRGAPR